MSGHPGAFRSSALRAAALTIQALDAALTRWHRPSTRKLLVRSRLTISQLQIENSRLRLFIVSDEPPFRP